MEKHQIEQLEKQVNELHTNMHSLTTQEPVSDLLQIIRRPGFTTKAEAMFLAGIIQAMHTHTNSIASLKKTMFEAVSHVGINPQPLPPRHQ